MCYIQERERERDRKTRYVWRVYPAAFSVIRGGFLSLKSPLGDTSWRSNLDPRDVFARLHTYFVCITTWRASPSYSTRGYSDKHRNTPRVPDQNTRLTLENAQTPVNRSFARFFIRNNSAPVDPTTTVVNKQLAAVKETRRCLILRSAVTRRFYCAV